MNNPIIEDSRINWHAVNNARIWYGREVGPDYSLDRYQQWMLDKNGIDHGVRHIRVVNEKKYMLFILRWS